MLQTVTLRQPFVRSAVGMPPLPSTSPMAGLLGMSPTQAAAATPMPAPKLEVALGGSTPLRSSPSTTPQLSAPR